MKTQSIGIMTNCLQKIRVMGFARCLCNTFVEELLHKNEQSKNRRRFILLLLLFFCLQMYDLRRFKQSRGA